MSLANSLALFLSMLVLAALPSLSVLTVTTRAVTAGFRHGAVTACGIVAGDLVFILLALTGIHLLLQAQPGSSLLLKIVGGLYLLWLGTQYWRSQPDRQHAAHSLPTASYRDSFAAGLLLTLADHKAILFYLVFFPAFVDLQNITPGDVGLITGITIISVGGVKIAYAWFAHKLAAAWPYAAALNRLGGLVLICIGLALLFKP